MFLDGLGQLGSSWVKEHHQQAAVSEWLRKSLESRKSSLWLHTQLYMSADWPTDLEECGKFQEWTMECCILYQVIDIQGSFKAGELGQIHLNYLPNASQAQNLKIGWTLPASKIQDSGTKTTHLKAKPNVWHQSRSLFGFGLHLLRILCLCEKVRSR